jgi:hypothetical protein
MRKNKQGSALYIALCGIDDEEKTSEEVATRDYARAT